MTSPPVSDMLRTALDTGPSTCRAWPEQDVGPYYLAGVPERRDVVEDAAGLPLALGLRLIGDQRDRVRGATVEIWHCDALGRYSGFPPPARATEYVSDRMFLRGTQTTDAGGDVEFRTVYPGWYPGRTIHIHLRARIRGQAFTSQLYFPEAINDEVLAHEPYVARLGRDTTNATDSIAATGGGPVVLDVTTSTAGYLATTSLLIGTAQRL